MRCVGGKRVLLVSFAMFGAATEVLAQSPGNLAPANPHASESYAMWMIKSLGLFGLLTLLAGAAVFLGACLVVFLARRPAVIAAYLVFLLAPLLFGTLGALKGTVSAFSVLAVSDTQITQSQIFAGISEALLAPLEALVVTLPSYFVIAIGLFVRTLQAGERNIVIK